jgi:hypothetical protein
MQNRYVCDVGDFGKYGLLNALSKSEGADKRSLRLGVVWYLVPDEKDNSDGKHKSYLDPSHVDSEVFRNCNPLLYEKLQKLLETGPTVNAIRKSNIFPTNTIFFDRPLDYANMPAIGSRAKEARVEYRSQWVKDAFSKTEDCEIILFDPDNGLETSIGRHLKKGPKYVFFDEVNKFWQRNQSLIIYQHIDHTDKAEKQIRKRITELKDKLQPVPEPFALLYRRGTSRAYIVIPAAGQVRILRNRTERFLQSEWGHNQIFNPNIY